MKYIQAKNTFSYEMYPNPPKKIYVTNKIVVFHIDSFWNFGLLDLIDCGPKNNKV